MHRTHRNGSRTATLATATALLVALGTGTATAVVEKPTEPGTLKLIGTAVGQVLADRKGNPLYIREADRPGRSGCTAACAKSWPAAVGSPKRAKGVTGRVSRTAKDAVGSDKPQVTFSTRPLYYFRSDSPNKPRGQNQPGFSLVRGNGTPVSGVKPPKPAASSPAARRSASTGEIASATARPPSAVEKPSRPRTTAPRPPSRTPARKTTPPRPARTSGITPKDRTTTPTPRRPVTPARPTAPLFARPASPQASASAFASASARPASTPPSRPVSSPVSSPARVSSASAGASVGALQITPSGAARGGADHLTAAGSTAAGGPSRTTALLLALATTLVAAAAGTGLVIRGRRLPKGGRH